VAGVDRLGAWSHATTEECDMMSDVDEKLVRAVSRREGTAVRVASSFHGTDRGA